MSQRPEQLLRGSKRQTYEGGIRVPFVIHWKGHVAAGKTFEQPVIQLDVLPTALAPAGVSGKASDRNNDRSTHLSAR